MKNFYRFLLCAVLIFTLAGPSIAQDAQPRFKAIAFDYFVIFNPDSVIAKVEAVYPGKGKDFTKLWRTKQFEYGFLRSITDKHEDFFKVTEDALIYTAKMMKLDLTAADKEKLLNAYLTMEPWPDAVAGLQKIRASGMRIITIANFSEKMLRANAQNAGITDLFDEFLSTEVNSTYKPDAAAYDVGRQHLGLKKEEIVFAAFGGWDAYGAKSYGYPTYWVNRFNLPTEQLGVQADATSNDFEGLLKFIFEPAP